MGRLTLNVLLSFAQFEREVTGERIRDKIAASKRKGMWMGGYVPLGFDASERTLVTNPAEAETVRVIFSLYREFGCVRRVKEAADQLGLRTKRRTTANGCERGCKPLSRGHIYRLLANPIYTGQIAHKGQLYPGQHPALIDAETWAAVQDQLAAKVRRHRSQADAAEPSLLAGMLTDGHGNCFTPSHAVRSGRRYRYYVSAAALTETSEDPAQVCRLPAQEVESAVNSILVEVLTHPARLLERFGAVGTPADQIRKMLGRAARLAAALSVSTKDRARFIRGLVETVIIDEQTIIIKIRRGALLGRDAPSPELDDPSASAIELTAAIAFKQRGVETKLILPGLDQPNHSARRDPALIKVIARGRAWFDELATGRALSLQALAEREGITRRYIRRLVGLAFLSPELVEAILQGRQPVDLTSTRLTELDLPLEWTEQRKLLAS
jgi:hypothetical protein